MNLQRSGFWLTAICWHGSNALVLPAFLHKLIVYPLEDHDAKEGIFIVRSDSTVHNDQKRVYIVTSR